MLFDLLFLRLDTLVWIKHSFSCLYDRFPESLISAPFPWIKNSEAPVWTKPRAIC